MEKLTATECRRLIKLGLQLHGTNAYLDKGADGILDMKKDFMPKFNMMPATEVRDVLLEMLDSVDPDCGAFVEYVIVDSDPREDFDDLFLDAGKILEVYY